MVQCVGHIKSGARCKRNAEADTIFCWQHSDESEIKFLDKHPEQKTELPKVEQKIVNVIYSRNDLLGQALQAGILDRITAYVYIPAETAKIFSLNSLQKHNYNLKKLKVLYPNILQWSIPKTYDITILYSLLTQKTNLSNSLILQTLQKNVIYVDFFTAFINTVKLEEFAEFLLLIYKNKLFTQFKEFYPTFATRLNTFLLDKYGPKTEEFSFDREYQKDIISDYYLVIGLYKLEDDVLRFLAPKTYLYHNHKYFENYHNHKFFENTKWEYDLNSWTNTNVQMVELYLQTHKASPKLKKYLGDLYYSTYGNYSTTWAYTVWKNFPKCENAVKSVVSCCTNKYPKAYKWGISIEYQRLEIGLDLKVPIALADVGFLNWLHVLFKKYSDEIYKDNKTFINDFCQYVHDKVLELNPSLLPKLDPVFNSEN